LAHPIWRSHEWLENVDIGTNVKRRNDNGFTLLKHVARSGFVSEMRVLIDNGAQVQAVHQKSGFPALRFAIDNNHEAPLLVLTAAGANCELKDKEGLTALH
jgi:ankyrin repeat protein